MTGIDVSAPSVSSIQIKIVSGNIVRSQVFLRILFLLTIVSSQWSGKWKWAGWFDVSRVEGFCLSEGMEHEVGGAGVPTRVRCSTTRSFAVSLIENIPRSYTRRIFVRSCKQHNFINKQKIFTIKNIYLSSNKTLSQNFVHPFESLSIYVFKMFILHPYTLFSNLRSRITEKCFRSFCLKSTWNLTAKYRSLSDFFSFYFA